MQRWYRSVKATGNKGHHIHTIRLSALQDLSLGRKKEKNTDTLKGTVTSALFIDRI